MELFHLTRKALEAIKENSYTGALIYGRKRIGKSIYSLLTLYQIYNDWDTVLDHCVFRLDDLKDRIKKAKNKPIKALIWDDTGIHGGKGQYFQDNILYWIMDMLFQVLGTRIKFIIMTTPDPDELMRFLRRQEIYRIKIVKRGYKDWRQAKAYKYIKLPNGFAYTPLVFKDNYRLSWIPGDVYKQYHDTRDSYVDEVEKLFDERLAEMEAKRSARA